MIYDLRTPTRYLKIRRREFSANHCQSMPIDEVRDHLNVIID